MCSIPRKDLSFDERDSAPLMPKCRVIDPAFTWGSERKPAVSWERTIVYEMHVKGFTKLTSIFRSRLGARSPDWRTPRGGLSSHPRHHQGRAAAVHAFVDDSYLVEKGLRNYWGYNSIAFFAPEPRYLNRAIAARVQGNGGPLPRRRHRSDSRRGLQPHRRRQRARARRCPSRASTTPPTIG